MASEKTVNYTAEQVLELLAAYEVDKDTKVLAEKFGRTERSVIAKLVQEKVYQTKAGQLKEKRKTKLEMLAEVEVAMGLDKGSLDSFEKGTLDAVKALYSYAAEYLKIGED